MKRKLRLMALVALAVGAYPEVARADCDLQKIIADCDAGFPPDSWLATPFKGWCYIGKILGCPAT